MANIVDIVIRAKDQASRALNAPIKSFGDLNKAMTALGPASKLVGGAVVGALTYITARSINTADELLKASQAIGTTVESLSTLKYAASQSGVEFDTLKTGLQKLSKNAVDAVSGNKEAAKGFEALSISVKDTNGHVKTNDELLKEVADKFAILPDGPLKTALAMQIFGKSAGPDMIPMLKMGADGINNLQNEAKQLGLEISTNTAKRAEQFNDNMSALGTISTRFGNAIMDKVLPSLGSFSSYLLDAYKNSTVISFWIDKISSGLGVMSKIAVAAASVIMLAFRTIGNSIGTVAAAAVAFLTGNISGAKDILSEGFKEIGTDLDKSVMDIDAMLKGKLNDPTMTNLTDVAIGDKSANGAKLQSHAELVMGNAKENARKLLEIETKYQEEQAALARRLDKKREDAKLDSARQAMDALISLSNSKNKVLAGIGKAAAIAQATMDTYAGATKALALLGPFGFPAAAAIILAGLNNVATIAGVELADGGIVKARPGGMSAIIGEGGKDEAVIPLDQTGGMFGPSESHVQVDLDGRRLLDFIYDSSRNGTLRIDKRAFA